MLTAPSPSSAPCCCLRVYRIPHESAESCKLANFPAPLVTCVCPWRQRRYLLLPTGVASGAHPHPHSGDCRPLGPTPQPAWVWKAMCLQPCPCRALGTAPRGPVSLAPCAAHARSDGARLTALFLWNPAAELCSERIMFTLGNVFRCLSVQAGLPWCCPGPPQVEPLICWWGRRTSYSQIHSIVCGW